MANKSHQESSEVKERILKAAFKLFSERGFDSTGVAHIAQVGKSFAKFNILALF